MADQARVRRPVRRRRKRGDLVVVPVEWSIDGTARVRLWRPDDRARAGGSAIAPPRRDPAPYVWGWSERFGLVAPADAARLRRPRRSDALESCDAAWVPMVRVVRLVAGAGECGDVAASSGQDGGVMSMPSSSLASSSSSEASEDSVGRASSSGSRSSKAASSASRRRVRVGGVAGSVVDGGIVDPVDPSEIVRAMTPQQRRRLSRLRAMQSAFLDAYASCGVARAAAQISGVPLTYHYEWLRDPEYASRFAMAQEEAIQRLEAEAVRRAVEGVEKPIYYRGRKIGSQREYSDMLLMFLLRAARPQKYREQQRIEHQVTGAGGGPIDLRSTQIDIASLPIELVESLARIGAEIRARTGAGSAAGMLPGGSGRVIDGVLSDGDVDGAYHGDDDDDDHDQGEDHDEDEG